LLALTRAGFLRRFFLGTVGGARKSLYAVSANGAELVGIPYRGPRRRPDEILAADFFTTHQLLVNELYCLLKFPAHTAGDAHFLRWASFHEPLAGTGLIPDGYVEITTPTRILSLFLEVDLGNESQSVWQQKIRAYLSYATSGSFAKEFSREQFRVLVVANSERRLNSLRTTTAHLTEKIFWFTTFEATRREGFWSTIWQRSADDRLQPLL